MPVVDLIGPTYELKQKSLSSQRTINWFIKQFAPDSGAKSKRVLVPTPGAVPVLVPNLYGTERCRGTYTASSGPGPDFAPRLYGCWGTSVVRFNQTLTAWYPIGTIIDDGNPVSMTDNGQDFVIVDGSNCYTYPLNNDDGVGTLSAINLPEIPGSTPPQNILPTNVCFLGQRLILSSANLNQWFFSDLGSTNFTVDNLNTDYIASTSWYSAESSSDPILSIRVNNGSLWIHGFRSYELWRTTDNAPDPFAFVAGSQSSIGTAAPSSAATINSFIFWLGGSDVGSSGVFVGNGTTTERISTPAIEDSIQSLGAAAYTGIGGCYAWKGYIFYVLTFPGSAKCFVYEAVTQTWCERLLRNVPTGEWESYPYIYYAFYNGNIYAGLNLADSTLVRFDDDTYTEWDGRTVVRQRISPCFFQEYNNIVISEVMLDAQVGDTPLLTGQGSNPQLLLEVSKDGGRTYGAFKPKPVGRQGQYTIPVRWHAQGMGRSIVLRFTFAEPAPLALYNMRLDFSPCGAT